MNEEFIALKNEIVKNTGEIISLKDKTDSIRTNRELIASNIKISYTGRGCEELDDDSASVLSEVNDATFFMCKNISDKGFQHLKNVKNLYVSDCNLTTDCLIPLKKLSNLEIHDSYNFCEIPGDSYDNTGHSMKIGKEKPVWIERIKVLGCNGKLFNEMVNKAIIYGCKFMELKTLRISRDAEYIPLIFKNVELFPVMKCVDIDMNEGEYTSKKENYVMDKIKSIRYELAKKRPFISLCLNHYLPSDC